MTVKEWLNRGRKIDMEINALIEEQRAAFASATGVVPSADGERVQASRRNSSEDRFVNYASYSKLIDKRIDELYAIKQEILTAINKLESSTLRMLLFERYVKCKTWEQIAFKMNYSKKHVIHCLHPKALSKIKNVIECNH